MATEFKESKISTLNNLIANEKMQVFQHQLFIDAADAGTTGNEVADAGLNSQADNARAIIAACSRRIDIYTKRLAELQAEAAA